jgi:hypothetical protein
MMGLVVVSVNDPKNVFALVARAQLQHCNSVSARKPVSNITGKSILRRRGRVTAETARVLKLWITRGLPV